jgi:hypothetical protein
VNVSPSVVAVWGLFSPVGTVTVFVPQTSTPVWDVTIWPSERVVVEARGRPPIVDVKVIVLPLETIVIVVTPVVGFPVWVPGAPVVEVKVIVLPAETVVMVVTPVAGAPRFPV